jgi:hypothetical protein
MEQPESKTRFVKALLLLSICLGLVGCSTAALKSAEQPELHARASGVLRVATYNICVGTRDLAQTAAVIRRMNADVIALQEVMPGRATILSRELLRDYRYRHFKGGLGIMSRFPMRKVHFERSRRGINGSFSRRSNGRMRQCRSRICISTRCGPGRSAKSSLCLSSCGGNATFIAMNWRRFLKISGRGRRRFCSVTSIAPAMPQSTVCVNSGFIDSFAVVTPGADRVPTLHFSILGFRSGRRVDFIFHSSAFRTIQSTVFRGQPSDHDALASVLSFNENTRRTSHENQGLEHALRILIASRDADAGNLARSDSRIAFSFSRKASQRPA